MKLEYINKENKYKKLRDVLIKEFNISSREITNLKKRNLIFLNNENTFLDKNLNLNDKIVVSFDYDEDNSNIIPLENNLDIIYEDEWLLIINKPPLMPIHPTSNHFDDTLSNIVKFYYDKINLKKKIRPVNRLDKDTSGIVVFAKNEYIQETLIKQMKNNTFKKTYIALIDGILLKKEDTINKPITRKLPSIIERKISDNGDLSITHYKVLKENKKEKISLLELLLETGRTHQIRVHMQYLNTPILGDTLYGKKSNLISRQALHSYKIEFIHPITKKNINFLANIPNDINNIIKTL